MKQEINQCIGCQAGWEVVWPKVGVFSWRAHLVKGGYPYEIVSCTKDHYGGNRKATR